ncbi:MAG: malonyl-CoA decarboxylase, partial [Proteobacteria bacterium]|nr:malonyl-CoA decarboxylase [Pseudomonadota bacterium]
FLKKIINSIADAGKELLHKTLPIKKNLETLLGLCDDLISYKGVASGIAIAREISEIYLSLSKEDKKKFFISVDEKFKPNLEAAEKKSLEFIKNKNTNTLKELSSLAEGNRQEFIRRMNMAPNGTAFLVSMREDLLRFVLEDSSLSNLDEDFRHLFRSWFNPGFLRLERITWDTKAAVLERIISYEKVHKIKDMTDLKRRLDEDRRFYAYFHPVLPDEPLIFVQVAFTQGLASSVQDIIKPMTPNQPKADTATFYSISNCQQGLTSVTLGNFLIKRVVYEIQQENPKIKHFGTLSPLPGFAEWVNYIEENKLRSILGSEDYEKVKFLRSTEIKIGDPRIIEHKKIIKKLTIHYLIKEKVNGKPVNAVTRFHLGNGASIENIVINGNISDYGYNESFGIMVNYIYHLDKLEKIHEEYISNHQISYSDKIKKYV